MTRVLEEMCSRKDEIIQNRRTVHTFAELGFDLPQTTAFVTEKLKSYGYQPQKCGKAGIVCTVGKGDRCVLLRADMDALPMTEETGLAFAAKNGNAHSCGHDCHTAMLLAAAQYLKQHESELPGVVKLMFQPAEELLAGAKDMIEAGVLEDPKVDCALAIHMAMGIDNNKTGRIIYVPGCLANSGDALKITVQGKGGHGSHPHLCVDAVNIAARIVLALDEIKVRELPMDEECIITVGTISGGTTVNSVADTAELGVSVRTASQETREYLIRRVEEVASSVATAFRASATTEHCYGVPPFINDPQILDTCIRALKEELPETDVTESPRQGGSEDFTMIAEKVPAAFMLLGGGCPEEGYVHSQHHPAMTVNEDALPNGAAALVVCAKTLIS